MLKYRSVILFALLACVAWVNNAIANETGEALFGQCLACHGVGPDAKHKFGPTLNGVMGKKIGVASDYEYSSAFEKAASNGKVWDEATMSEFLESPMSSITGTKMAFPGVKDKQARSDLIEYLTLFDENGVRSDQPADPKVSTNQETVEKPRDLATAAVIPEHGQFHLGRIALEEEVQAWDIDVRPDGQGLPTGAGDAYSGAEIYDAQCASCHGDFGEGVGRWPILAGGQGSLTEDRPEKTIGSYWPYLSTVYDYIRRAMPFGNARSLSDDDIYAVTAYLLYLNDEVDEDFELTSENFTDIRLPNEENFIADNRADEKFRKVSAHDVCMTDCFDEPAVVTQRAQVLDVTPDE